MARSHSVARDRLLDGLRGVAILLVLLSHAWTVAPTTDWSSVSWLFFSGDYAVTIFFVVSGFLATRAMLASAERTGNLRPGVLWARRWLRISPVVYVMVLVVLLVSAATTSVREAYAGTDGWGSAMHIATYTWSGYLRTNAYEARPDFGHLWYVCTDIWGIAMILVVVYFLRRWRPALLAALLGLVVIITAYRYHVWHTEGAFAAMVRVQTRADGLVWGAIAAVVLPWTRPLDRYMRYLAVVAAAALVPLMGAVHRERDYLHFWGTVLSVTVAVLVLGVSSGAPGTPPAILQRLIAREPLVVAGRASLVLYVWHYPIFWYFAKLDTDWGWQARTFVALSVTVVAAVLSQAYIERPTQRWLGSQGWQAFDRGIAPGLLTSARQGRDQLRHQVAAHVPRRGEVVPRQPRRDA